MKKAKKYDALSVLLEYGILLVLLFLIVIFSFLSSNFLSVNTLITILKQISITGITSIGMCYVILTGGIDLSVGSIAAVTAVSAAMFMQNGWSSVSSVIAALCLALIFGMINGFSVTKLHMPALIATLGTQTALRGVAYIVTGGLPVHGFSDSFGNFAKASILGIPYMAVCYTHLTLPTTPYV